MKAGHLLFPLAAIIFFESCRANEDEDNGPFPHVGAYYCVKVREIQNTCSEPRDLPSPIAVLYRQVIATNGEPTQRITFQGGGLEFPAELDSDGRLRAYVGNYAYDENIDKITYTGKFTGTNGLINYHETIGQDEDEPCISAGVPCHLRIEYKNGACLGESNGYNVVSLWGPRIAPEGGCPAQLLDDEVRFSALP